MRRIAGWLTSKRGAGRTPRNPGNWIATNRTAPSSTPTTMLVTPSQRASSTVATMIAPLRAACDAEGQAKRPSA
jgi:hypothetical protein